MMKKTVLALNAICPIIGGALIYYFVAPDVIFVKKIDAVIGNVAGIHITSIDNIFFKLVRNYFPDMLWGYAFVFVLFYVIGNNAVKKIFWIALSFSVAMEVIQIAPFVQGTFDIFDIAVEFLAEALAVFIINKITLREELRNEKEN
jgi:hypothetical protein